jgi:hypothetical protein
MIQTLVIVAFEIEIQEINHKKKITKSRDIDHTTIILELEKTKKHSQFAFAKEMTKC